MSPGLLTDPARFKADIRQPPQLEPEPTRGKGLDDRTALEYGSISARFSTITLARRDASFERSLSRGFGSMEGGICESPLDHAAGYIAGFSGSISYRLVAVAVAGMLGGEGELLTFKGARCPP